MTTDSIPQEVRHSSNSTFGRCSRVTDSIPQEVRRYSTNLLDMTTDSVHKKSGVPVIQRLEYAREVSCYSTILLDKHSIPQKVRRSSNSTFGRCSRNNIFLTSLTQSLWNHADCIFRVYLVLSGVYVESFNWTTNHLKRACQ